jgi:hypothetical protein
MAPILLRSDSSGDHIRQLSRSIPKALSSIPKSPQAALPAELYASLHQNIPFVPRTIQHVANFLSQLSVDSSVPLSKRQTAILAIPTRYAGLNSGPPPGTVAGIVLGSVAGFLLLLWLIYACLSQGGIGLGGGQVIEEEIVRRRSRSPRRSRSHSETIEIQKSRSPVRRERERIVVEEETRRVSRPPDPDQDIVEVIEENSVSASPPPRRTSKRASGYRTVDPTGFGGGGRPMRKVR